jgi:uncharacterized protein with NRDE domain
MIFLAAEYAEYADFTQRLKKNQREISVFNLLGVYCFKLKNELIERVYG